jgi:hypothetical protein
VNVLQLASDLFQASLALFSSRRPLFEIVEDRFSRSSARIQQSQVLFQLKKDLFRLNEDLFRLSQPLRLSFGALSSSRHARLRGFADESPRAPVPSRLAKVLVRDIEIVFFVDQKPGRTFQVVVSIDEDRFSTNQARDLLALCRCD